MINDRIVRTSITRESHLYFFHLYFAHYVKYATADFQKEIIALTENNLVKNLFIVAFRGSGKSTIITTSYPIWSILGRQQKKFVLILCHTRSQAKQHMMNLRRELENNQLLRSDLGPFQEENDEWGSSSLVFSNYGARITVASAEQSVRGLRHNQYRPDLIICDDVEDISSTKTREGRQKTHQWLTGEVIPAGDRDTRLIIIGNLLHEDSLLMRVADDLKKGNLTGEYRRYPLLDDNEAILWPGKFPSMTEIEEERQKVGNDVAWQREYLLNIIPDDDQVIDPNWINYYDALPPITHRAYRGTYAAVDLAISKNETADYTAVVSAMIFGRAEKLRIYILPNPIIKKLNFPEQVDLLRSMKATTLSSRHDMLYVESIGYQDALAQMLETMNIKAVAVRPTADKRTRLALTAPMIRSGKVKFPRTGAEEIIEQIVGFGVEKHDDAADALSMLLNQIAEEHYREPTWIMAAIGPGTTDDDIVRYSDYVDIGDQY